MYLFGSVLTRKTTPNDIDVIIISRGCSGSGNWNYVRHFSKNLAKIFMRTFKIPLSVIVVTMSEWREFSGIIVRRRLAILGSVTLRQMQLDSNYTVLRRDGSGNRKPKFLRLS
jgi:predicted nucleotidyltransferase